ncbi:peptidylprolyl isomerase [Microbacterium lacus]|uniref:peptidylprolyl isomerase n=1 Tax=Microbacterium lacus TaxID=415217 RepID=UPI00384FB87F
MRRTSPWIVTLLALGLLTGCASATPEAGGTAAPESGACEYIEAAGGVRDVDAPPADPASGTIDVVLTTSAGEIPITLDADSAPCTVGSFLSLAEQGYFDETSCHRLTTQGIFVLQCGDPSATGRGGPGYSYADELDGSETYPAGTVAMANAGPNTNGSQFFLVFADTELPPSYTVFGQMDAAGIEAVKAVAMDGVAGGGPDGNPATEVTIESVHVR